MDKYEQEQINELVGSQSVQRFVDEDGTSIGLLILNRGEQMFYQEDGRAFICEISARFGIVYLNSIRKWNTKKKITEEEKTNVVKRLKKFYPLAYKDEVTFS